MTSRVTEPRGRRWKVWLPGIALALLLAAGGYGYLRFQRMVARQIPVFVEPGPGPRAPAQDGLGFRVGLHRLDQVQQRLADLGLRCRDTSISALVRAGVAAEIRKREAAGDSTLGARLYGWLNPHGRNPQVRLSCEGTAASVFGEPRRQAATGRLLLVHDAPDAPLRHVSYQRTQVDPAAAHADLHATVAALTRRFGPPSQRVHPEALALAVLPELTPVTVEWRFADVRAEVTAIRYGSRGVVLSETVEVPWPVRADAPGDGVRGLVPAASEAVGGGSN